MISLSTSSISTRCPGALAVRKPLSRTVPRLARLPVSAGAESDDKAKQPKKPTGPVSGDYKRRLAEEYTGLGGAPNKPMSQNYFLWIIGIISFLAIASYLTGSI